MTAGEFWREGLAQWAIPKEILAQAPTSPWIHPVQMFTVVQDQDAQPSPSDMQARAALTSGRDSVLDIGCGGGRSTAPLIPPATNVIGVDHQEVMLQKFSEMALARGATPQTFLGDWPEISGQVPKADVVVCHHVLYNVEEIEKFLVALNEHARHRVVIELPLHHPLHSQSWLWQHFWGISRPTEPNAHLALEIIRDLGYRAEMTEWSSPMRANISLDEKVEFTRIRLCLTADRDEEIRELLINHEEPERELVTLWWDV